MWENERNISDVHNRVNEKVLSESEKIQHWVSDRVAKIVGNDRNLSKEQVKDIKKDKERLRKKYQHTVTSYWDCTEEQKQKIDSVLDRFNIDWINVALVSEEDGSAYISAGEDTELEQDIDPVELHLDPHMGLKQNKFIYYIKGR